MKRLIIIISVLIALGGCVAEDGTTLDTLPIEARGVTDAGNGWVEFDYGEDRILMSPLGGMHRVGPADPRRSAGCADDESGTVVCY